MGHDPTTTPARLSRRSFLAAGGAVLGAAMLGPNPLPRPTALHRLASRPGPRLSVGYVEGSAGMTAAEVRALLEAGGAHVVPATALAAGGAPAGGGAARIHVDASTLGSANGGDGRRAAQLDALVQPEGGTPDELVPFYAWTMQGGAQQGSAVSFAVPFERHPTLGLALRTREGDGSPWSESTAVLTGGRDAGMARLRDGAYVVGLRPDVWSAPRTLPAAGDAAWGRVASLVFSVHPI